MPNGLGPFNIPRRQRRSIDPAQLASYLAAPEVARQQSRADIFGSLAQLPQQFIQTVQQQKQLAKSIRKITPQDALGKSFPEVIGMTTEEAKAFVGPIISARKTGVTPKVPRVSAESARATGSAESGVTSAKKALDILAKDPNAARKILAPLGAGFAMKAKDKQLQLFDREITNLSDAIIRARTGAAATKEEIVNFKKILIGNVFQDPSVTRQSIQAIQKELSSVVKRMAPVNIKNIEPNQLQILSDDELNALLGQ